MPDWFAPKRYGYGAGLPIAGQGWAVMLAYFVVLGLPAWLLASNTAILLGVVALATIALLVVAMRTTRGGWRWRNGDGD